MERAAGIACPVTYDIPWPFHLYPVLVFSLHLDIHLTLFGSDKDAEADVYQIETADRM